MTDPNLSLSESAWQKAKLDAARIYPTTAFGVAATLVTTIFGAFTAVVAAGENTTTQIAVPIIGGAFALALTFAVLFFIQLAAAPVRQRDELRAAWKLPAIETANIDLTLRNAYRKGNDLAKQLDRATQFTKADLNAAESWADEVVEMMAGKAPDDATRDFLAVGKDEPRIPRRLRQRVDALHQIIDALP